MATIQGTLNFNAAFNQIVSSGVVSTQNIPASLGINWTPTSGTGTGAVDLCYAKQLSLAGSATTLDLTSVTDLSGASVSFARVRLIVVQNLATTAGYTVTIGAAASNQWTGFLGTTTSTLVLQPNVGATTNHSAFVATDIYSTGSSTGAYVDSTHKSLKLDPGANTISVNVFILGCSAAS